MLLGDLVGMVADLADKYGPNIQVCIGSGTGDDNREAVSVRLEYYPDEDPFVMIVDPVEVVLPWDMGGHGEDQDPDEVEGEGDDDDIGAETA